MSHIAELFPAMPEDRLRALADDIKARGLLDPIIVFDGKIIDGRHRYLACQMASVEPRFSTFTGTEADALNEAISRNVLRRDMDPAQRAMVAGRLANLRHGVRLDRSTDLSMSQERAAALLNVSVPSVKRARVVLRSGDDQLIASVDNGKSSLRAAYDIARAQETANQAVDKTATLPVSDQAESLPVDPAPAKKEKPKKPERHAVHRKMHYRKPNREVERAIFALDGICIGLDQIDIDDLDPSRCDEWAADFKKIASAISTFSRSLKNVTQHSTQSFEVRHGSCLGSDDRSCGTAEAVNGMGQQTH